MKRLFALLLVVLPVVALSFGCNGADPITDPGDPGKDLPVTPTPVPRQQVTPRPDPDPCPGKLQQRCDDRQERSAS
jgi:hypothetical protein